MEDDAPVIYGLEFQARALTAQTAETDAIRFLVGTQSLKFDNQIHIIDFDDENNVINKNVLLHQAGEIWHIAASPADKAVLSTCYNKTSDSRVVSCAAVWRMPSDWESGSHESPDDSAHNPQTLELLCRLDDSSHGNAACVLWEPMGDGKRLISLADNHALLWDLQESSTQATVSSAATLEGKGQLKFTSGKWSPHHNCSQLATANDTAIRGWDLRTMSVYGCPLAKKRKSLDRQTLETSPKRSTYLDDMDNSTMEECYETDGTEEMDDREEEEEEGAVEEEGEVEEEEEDVEGYMDYNEELMEHGDGEEDDRGDGEEEEEVEVEQEEEEEEGDEVREEEEEEEETIEEVDYEDGEEEEGEHNHEQGERTFLKNLKTKMLFE
ncbi:tumor suppressing subtransferable candidate 1, partial [Nothobranchius furzeri]